MADALLDVRRLSRRFAAVDALKAVDFSVQAGEIHALIGPNGAGKPPSSTTFPVPCCRIPAACISPAAT